MWCVCVCVCWKVCSLYIYTPLCSGYINKSYSVLVFFCCCRCDPVWNVERKASPHNLTLSVRLRWVTFRLFSYSCVSEVVIFHRNSACTWILMYSVRVLALGKIIFFYWNLFVLLRPTKDSTCPFSIMVRVRLRGCGGGDKVNLISFYGESMLFATFMILPFYWPHFDVYPNLMICTCQRAFFPLQPNEDKPCVLLMRRKGRGGGGFRNVFRSLICRTDWQSERTS